MELNYDNKEKYTRITEDGELIIDDVITEINSNTFVVPKDEKDSFFDSFIEGKNNLIKHLNVDVKKVRIPEGVTKIRKELFSNFRNLEEVILPESLNEIEIDAFRECINLKKINIPNNVEKIGERAFKDCEVLENVELPEKIELIESFAFQNCQKLNKIVIPESVKRIEKNAFSNCSNLEGVVLSEKIQSIGENAFCNCIKLENINFPDSLIREENAFEGCSKEIIKSIPARLICDKNGTLNKFHSEFLIDNSFIIPEGVKRIEKLEGYIKFINEKIDNRLWRESEEEYNQRIDKYKIKEIEIPNSVLAIGDYAINNFDYLEKVNMPDSIIELGKGNFIGCSELNKVRLSRNLKLITKDVVNALRNEKLSCIIIPDSVKKIDGGYEFKDDRYYDKSHGRINLDTITYFNKEHIPRMYDSTETGSSQQISVTENEIFKYYSKHGFRQDILKEENKNLEKQITMSDIKDLDKRKKIVISSDNIKKIGPFALAQCPNLEEVVIEEGITEIGPGAFAECENLKKVHFPKSLKKISDYAFFNCDKIEEVKIKSKSLTLGDFCFSNCEALQFAEFPERVENVGKNAFYKCGELKYIGGMENVDKIDDYAFAECEQLKISIPHKIKEIGDCAYICSGMKNWSFKDVNNSDLIEYPFNETIIIIPSSLEKIGREAFNCCQGITQLYFNQGSKLKEIPFGAFHKCNLMSFIEFPDEMVKINDYAFAECKSLEEIYLPESIQEIGKQSFRNCKSLKLAMFKGKRKGEELSKPDAFDGCENLKILNFSDLEFNTKKIDGESYDVVRKEKNKKSYSITDIKEFLTKKKDKER